MPRLRVDASSAATDPHIPPTASQWWLPSQPDRCVGGVLTYDEEGGVLDLAGSLQDDDVAIPPVVLLGLTSTGERLTIADGYIASSRTQGPVTAEGTDRFVQQEWRFFQIHRGAHFDRGADELFEFFEFTPPTLADWLTIPRPKHRDEGAVRILQVDVPSQVEIPIENGRLYLYWAQSRLYGTVQAETMLRPTFRYEPTPPMTLDEAEKAIVQPLQFFLSLAVGQPSLCTEVRVGLGSARDDTYRTATVPSARRQEVFSDRAERDWEHLIPFKPYQDRIADVLGAWIEVAARHRSALLGYFSVLERPTSMYMEEQFLQTVRSLEIWHRGAVAGTTLLPTEFEALKAKLRTAVTADEWTFLGSRLNHANEPSLKKRLEGLIEACGSPIGEIFERHPRLLRRIVDSRDTLTHVGSEEQKLLGDHELFYAQKILAALFSMVLLHEIGLGDVAPEQMTKTPLWRWVKVADKRL